jgi:hypothetical protein
VPTALQSNWAILMKIRNLLASAMPVLLAVMAIAFIYLASGPELDEMEVAKLLPEKVALAALRADIDIVVIEDILPGRVELPVPIGIKYNFKRAARAIGFALLADESAKDFRIKPRNAERELHCLARLVGDHLLGLEVSYNPAELLPALRLQDALKIEFPSWERFATATGR